MVVVYIAAGLANKMFQYAFACGLKHNGLDVYLDQSSFKPEWDFEDISLQEVFTNLLIEETPVKKFKLAYKFDLMSRIYKKLSRYFLDGRYIFEKPFYYDPKIHRKATNDCIYCGLWQSELYFQNCLNEVRQSFTFHPFEDEKNKICKNKMENENSVAIHIRKGQDYQIRDIWEGTCSIEYYQNAIKHIRENVKNPVFYVFTDNPDWVCENINNLEYILVDWNETSGKNSYRDMQLMSCAKHNIIANSTYSWWGAWLNANSRKIVIAPKKWFNPKIQEAPYIVPQGWIKL